VDTVTLPAGLTVRPPTLDDAERILELVSAYNTRLVGFGDYTLDDINDELTEPGYDPATDGWLVFDADRLVGYGWSYHEPASDVVDIDVIADDPRVSRWLLEQTLDRARAMGRAQGLTEVKVDKAIYRTDEAMRDLVTAYGLVAGTTFHRMRIEHTGPVPMPSAPPDVLVHEGAYDEATRRAAHQVIMASFDGHYGHVFTPYEDWLAAHEARSTFDWSQLVVLELDGQPVAASDSNDQFVADEDCGYVAQLGVVREARGRGLAKYLLRRAFAVNAANGRSGTILHVDTNNTTPALGLYESVGMKPYLIIDAYRATVSV
jgi:mycothiol synthase